MENEVKISYCKDDEGNYIYYNDVEKGKKYFCIDCGDDLIVHDGDIKVKHLAHKANTDCQGTGESVFHQHWKTDLFKQGLYINVRGEDYEILEVHNEVSLKKYYHKDDWDRDIIVDTLLVTTGGDVVVEIKYTNKKSWVETAYYYNRLKLLEVYEVEVSKTINSDMIWNTRKVLLKKELEQMTDSEDNEPDDDIDSLGLEKNTDKCQYNMKDEDLVREAIRMNPKSTFFQSVCGYFMQHNELTSKQRESLIKQLPTM